MLNLNDKYNEKRKKTDKVVPNFSQGYDDT